MLLCLFCLGCSSMLGSCSMSDSEDSDEVVERVKVGDRVPSFTAEMVGAGGSTFTFSSADLKGETVIVFFNTWCKDCQRELPRLNDYYLQHREDEGFQMVAISRAEAGENVADFWADNGLQIPYSAQEDRHIYDLFASSVIPRVYFCSAQGIVTKVFIETIEGDL